MVKRYSSRNFSFLFNILNFIFPVCVQWMESKLMEGHCHNELRILLFRWEAALIATYTVMFPHWIQLLFTCLCAPHCCATSPIECAKLFISFIIKCKYSLAVGCYLVECWKSFIIYFSNFDFTELQNLCPEATKLFSMKSYWMQT